MNHSSFVRSTFHGTVWPPCAAGSSRSEAVAPQQPSIEVIAFVVFNHASDLASLLARGSLAHHPPIPTASTASHGPTVGDGSTGAPGSRQYQQYSGTTAPRAGALPHAAGGRTGSSGSSSMTPSAQTSQLGRHGARARGGPFVHLALPELAADGVAITLQQQRPEDSALQMHGDLQLAIPLSGLCLGNLVPLPLPLPQQHQASPSSHKQPQPQPQTCGQTQAELRLHQPHANSPDALLYGVAAVRAPSPAVASGPATSHAQQLPQQPGNTTILLQQQQQQQQGSQYTAAPSLPLPLSPRAAQDPVAAALATTRALRVAHGMKHKPAAAAVAAVAATAATATATAAPNVAACSAAAPPACMTAPASNPAASTPPAALQLSVWWSLPTQGHAGAAPAFVNSGSWLYANPWSRELSLVFTPGPARDPALGLESRQQPTFVPPGGLHGAGFAGGRGPGMRGGGRGGRGRGRSGSGFGSGLGSGSAGRLPTLVEGPAELWGSLAKLVTPFSSIRGPGAVLVLPPSTGSTPGPVPPATAATAGTTAAPSASRVTRYQLVLCLRRPPEAYKYLGPRAVSVADLAARLTPAAPAAGSTRGGAPAQLPPGSSMHQQQVSLPSQVSQPPPLQQQQRWQQKPKEVQMGGDTSSHVLGVWPPGAARHKGGQEWARAPDFFTGTSALGNACTFVIELRWAVADAGAFFGYHNVVCHTLWL